MVFKQTCAKPGFKEPFFWDTLYIGISFSIFLNNHGWTTWGVGVAVLGVEYGRGHRKVPWGYFNIIIID